VSWSTNVTANAANAGTGRLRAHCGPKGSLGEMPGQYGTYGMGVEREGNGQWGELPRAQEDGWKVMKGWEKPCPDKTKTAQRCFFNRGKRRSRRLVTPG
jgi:hypothetical protein